MAEHSPKILESEEKATTMIWIVFLSMNLAVFLSGSLNDCANSGVV